MIKYVQPIITKLCTHSLDITVLGLFFIYACLMTWPLVAQPSTTLTAPLIGDVSNSVSKFDSIKQEHVNPLMSNHLSTIAAPEGVATNTSVDRVSLFSTLFLWIATALTSSVVAHGFFTFLGYFLTATVLYFFIKQVFKSRYIAFISGAIYASFPLFISLARAAPIYNHMWLYILPVYAFFMLWKKPSNLSLFITALSIIPALLWTPYFTLHILIIGLSLLIAYSIYTYRSLGLKRIIATTAVLAGSWITLLGLYYLLGSSSEGGGAPVRTIAEAYEQSIHPLMLILPGAFSWWGQPGYELLYSIKPRAYDTNLYLGISVISLSVFGLYCLISKKIRKTLPPSVVLVGFFGASISTISLLFSLAPTINILGVDVPTLNNLVVNIMPALRAGQRLAAPIMLGLILLLSVSLFVIFKRISSKNIQVAIGVILAAMIFFDLSSKPPGMTAQLPQSDAMKQLSLAEKGIVAQYMNGSLTRDPTQLPCQLRLIHNNTIFNHCGLEIDYPAGQTQPIHTMSILPLSQQFEYLRNVGVKYIVLEHADNVTITALQFGDQNTTKIISDSRFVVFRLD